MGENGGLIDRADEKLYLGIAPLAIRHKNRGTTLCFPGDAA
jgi:hypothetical protein